MNNVTIQDFSYFKDGKYSGELFLKSISNRNIYNCNVIGPNTNLGFRLAYFLWIMRGANLLNQLNYYSKHVNDMSDEANTLRGAYGPRLRFWIGADQLQEAINKNMDVDCAEDMAKPVGIDQLEYMFNDLKYGQTVTSCVVFNPSIDYEKSNYIPDLVSISFYGSKSYLDMHCLFNSADILGHFVNDFFFLSLLHVCMGNILGRCSNKFQIHILNATAEQKIEKVNIISRPLNDDCELPKDKDYKSLFKNIYRLCEFERHARAVINVETAENSDVNLHNLCDDLRRNFLEEITDDFWLNYGLTMLAFMIMDNCGEKYNDCVESIMRDIRGPFYNELLDWKEAHNV